MQLKENRKLYIFDFDGTITKKDSLIEFLKFSFSTLELLSISIRFLPYFLQKVLGLITNSNAKQKLYSIAFKGISFEQFNKKCENFSNDLIPSIVYKDFLEYIERIDTNLSDIYIVSASIENYLLFWTSKKRFNLISTKLEFKDLLFTGYFSTPNCNYEEKKIRILEEIDISKYKEIHIFGNSKGDFAMFELATHRYYRFFKN